MLAYLGLILSGLISRCLATEPLQQVDFATKFSELVQYLNQGHPVYIDLHQPRPFPKKGADVAKGYITTDAVCQSFVASKLVELDPSLSGTSIYQAIHEHIDSIGAFGNAGHPAYSFSFGCRGLGTVLPTLLWMKCPDRTVENMLFVEGDRKGECKVNNMVKHRSVFNDLSNADALQPGVSLVIYLTNFEENTSA